MLNKIKEKIKSIDNKSFELAMNAIDYVYEDMDDCMVHITKCGCFIDLCDNSGCIHIDVTFCEDDRDSGDEKTTSIVINFISRESCFIKIHENGKIDCPCKINLNTAYDICIDEIIEALVYSRDYMTPELFDTTGFDKPMVELVNSLKDEIDFTGKKYLKKNTDSSSLTISFPNGGFKPFELIFETDDHKKYQLRSESGKTKITWDIEKDTVDVIHLTNDFRSGYIAGIISKIMKEGLVE